MEARLKLSEHAGVLDATVCASHFDTTRYMLVNFRSHCHMHCHMHGHNGTLEIALVLAVHSVRVSVCCATPRVSDI
jgi:hypothetical protein